MPTQISGSAGVSKVQDGVVVTADIADLAITPKKMSQKMTLMQSVDVTTLSDKTKCDFTGIPSWVKRITVMFNGVSTNGTSNYLIQIGDSGGIENTGYAGASTVFGVSTLLTTTSSSGFLIVSDVAANTHAGSITLSNIAGNSWACSGTLSRTNATVTYLISGTKTLSDALTQLRITTVNGTDTFDAGTINVLYEG